jgi:hypothetical protein
MALLEEIASDRAHVAVETAYPPESAITITADGFEVRSRVVECRTRENDFCLELRFDKGMSWSPELWRPDYLYRSASASKQKGKAFGAGA